MNFKQYLMKKLAWDPDSGWYANSPAVQAAQKADPSYQGEDTSWHATTPVNPNGGADAPIDLTKFHEYANQARLYSDQAQGHQDAYSNELGDMGDLRSNLINTSIGSSSLAAILALLKKKKKKRFWQ